MTGMHLIACDITISVFIHFFKKISGAAEFIGRYLTVLVGII